MKPKETRELKFRVIVEQDRTCSVLIGEQEYAVCKVGGLTPEQATAIKQQFENVFRLGLSQGFRDASKAVRHAEEAVFGQSLV